jgi:hypothetical protein
MLIYKSVDVNSDISVMLSVCKKIDLYLNRYKGHKTYLFKLVESLINILFLLQNNYCSNLTFHYIIIFEIGILRIRVYMHSENSVSTLFSHFVIVSNIKLRHWQVSTDIDSLPIAL